MASVLSIPFEDILIMPVIGTFTRLFGLSAFAVWALSLLHARRFRRPTIYHFLAYGFVVWTFASTFWSADPSLSAGKAITYLQLLGYVLIIWDLCRNREELLYLMQSYVLGAWVTSGNLLLRFVQGRDQQSFFRYTSAGSDPNYMAIGLALAMVFAWFLAMRWTNRWARWINIIYVPIGALGIALSGSRAGLAAGGIAMFYILSRARRLQPIRLAIVALVIAAGAYAIANIVPAETLDRLASTGNEFASGDLSGRTDLWKESVDAFWERPVFGSGTGTNRVALPSGKVSHNVLFSVAVELGLIGIILLGLIVGVVARRAAFLPAQDRQLWIAILSIWAIGASSLSMQDVKMTWLLFSLIVGYSYAQTERVNRSTISTRVPNTQKSISSARDHPIRRLQRR
jgi:O-antigen ligase